MIYNNQAKNYIHIKYLTIQKQYYGETILLARLRKRTIRVYITRRKEPYLTYSGFDPIRINKRIKIW